MRSTASLRPEPSPMRAAWSDGFGAGVVLSSCAWLVLVACVLGWLS